MGPATTFQLPLHLGQILVPPICSGTMLISTVLFLYIYYKKRTWNYLAAAILGFLGILFTGSETMVLYAGGWLRMPLVGVQFHRLEQLAGAYFLFALPFFLAYNLTLTPVWKRVHQVMAAIGLIAALSCTAVAFLDPDQFVSLAIHHTRWTVEQSMYGRGQTGPWLTFRDIFMGLYGLYALVIVAVDIIWKKQQRYLVLMFLGLAVGLYAALIDIVYVHTQVLLPPLANVSFSRFTLGITVLIVMMTSGVFRRLLTHSEQLGRTYQALTYSEERFYNLAEMLPEAVFECDLQLNLGFVNRKALQLFGYDEKDFQAGINGIEFFVSADRERARTIAQRIALGEDAGQGEYRGLRKDGTTVPLLLHVNRIMRGGVPVGFRGVIVDLTTLKAAEQELRDSERRFREFAEMLPEAVFESDLDTNLTYVNQKAFAVFQYAKDDFDAGLNGIEMLVPEDQARARRNLKKRAAGVRLGLVEYTGVTKDGERFPLLLSLTPIIHRERPVGFRGAIIDIREHKRVEEKLKHSEERFHMLANMLPEAVVETDIHGKVTFANQKAFDLFGYSQEDLERGLDSFAIVIEDDRERARENTLKRAKGVEIGAVEYTGVKSDGTPFPVLLHNTVIYDGDKPVGFRGTITDLTETKILNERLRRAEKMEAIGVLAGGVAHDFNNILCGIVGYADLARMDLPPESRLDQYMSNILQSSERGRKLVKQILTFSRSDDEVPTPLYLRPIIREAIELLRASMPSTLHIKSKTARDTLPVLAVATQVHEIVVNLCTNAAHAMNNQGTLDIYYEEKEIAEAFFGRNGTTEPGMYSVLTVRDHGRGITKDVMPNIFDPFFTTKDTGEGTGMGLAVLFGIVQSHNGNITVESEPGTGSTFRVYLPKTDDPVTAPRVTETEPAANGKERLLVVDDEPLIVETVEHFLSKLGYTVSAYTDSLAALKAIRNAPHDFDLIIADQTMPNLSGLDLAREIRTIHNDVPIILCSGYSQALDDTTLEAEGIDGFLAKPFRNEDLSRAIRKLLKKRGSKPTDGN